VIFSVACQRGAGRSCGRSPDGLAYVQGTRARQRRAGDADALERARLKFPAAAIAVLEFTATWQKLGPERAPADHFRGSPGTPCRLRRGIARTGVPAAMLAEHDGHAARAVALGHRQPGHSAVVTLARLYNWHVYIRGSASIAGTRRSAGPASSASSAASHCPIGQGGTGAPLTVWSPMQIRPSLTTGTAGTDTSRCDMSVLCLEGRLPSCRAPR
jgi:hypothetical protein